MKTLLTTLLLLFSMVSAAEPPSAAASAEVTHLLSYLESSNCQFYRNGTWYSAAEAKNHLNSKYEYLLGQDKVPTAEAFIELAATKSSMSGKDYMVKCKDGVARKSAAWLNAELIRLRKNGK